MVTEHMLEDTTTIHTSVVAHNMPIGQCVWPLSQQGVCRAGIVFSISRTKKQKWRDLMALRSIEVTVVES